MDHELTLKQVEVARIDSSQADILMFEMEQIEMQKETVKMQLDSLNSLYAVLEVGFNNRKAKEVSAYTTQLRKQHFLASEMKALLQHPITILLAFAILCLHILALILHQRILFREDSKFYNHMVYHDRAIVKGHDKNTVEAMRRDLKQKFGYDFVDKRAKFQLDPPFDNSLIMGQRTIIEESHLYS